MASNAHISPIEFAQTLKQQIMIDQVVSEYVPSLNKSGGSFKGLCPFHKEKTPSFHVHPEFGYYHCFGCGAHGDVIKFVQEIEKIDFMLALETLARRAGVTLPQFRASLDQRPEQEQHLADLRQLSIWAAEFFASQLEKHPRGRMALDYLRGRGLNEEHIVQYGLGYAPEGYETLLRAAAARGWSSELVAEAGLASRREQGGYIDRFRDRVMFTILDRQGQPVAFAGRLLEDQPDAAKYINSAETPIFKKSNILYGQWLAREAIKNSGEVIMLEGYMDWITMHRSGIQHVLAGMGTALTEEQSRLIRRIAGRVILLYDGDAAGQKAMFRSSELLLRQGLDVRAAVLPVEHDPDTYIAAEGTQAMRDLLAAAPHTIDYFLENTARQSDLNRPEGKADAVGRLAPLLLAIENPALREGYLTRSANRLGLRLETLESTLRRRTGRMIQPEKPGEAVKINEPAKDPPLSEQNLLYILFSKRELWAEITLIDPGWFQDETLRSIFERLNECQRDIREGADPPEDPFAICENERQRDWISRILLLPTRRFGGEVEDFDKQLTDGFQMQLFKMKKMALERRKRELSQDLITILSDSPTGKGHLAAIDAIAREAVQHHAQMLDQQQINRN